MSIRYQLDILEPLGATASLHQLGPGTAVLGRSADCDVSLDVAGLSRRHVEIEVLLSGGAVVRDLGSTNGTRLNGRDIERAAAADDFVLDLGAAVLRFRASSDAGSELAYKTDSSPEVPVEDSTDPEPETRIMTLQRTLKQDLWGAVNTPNPSLESLASKLLPTWRHSLKARSLQLERSGGEVMAAAGNTDDELCEMARSEDCVLLADARTAGQAGLAELAGALLQWLPDPSSETSRPPSAVARFPGIWPGDRAIQRQFEALGRVAGRQVSILLLGETGVGKDLLAQWIHACSPQAQGPFLAINCAALPKDLLEAELFGIEAGAATGVSARPGVFEQANGGTLFLDEVGDMAADTQVRLLRALEDGKIYRVGGREPLALKVRLVSATNQNIDQAIEDGRFRRDLYHRIAAFETLVPPLRERREDIAELSIHFFNQALRDAQVSSPGLTRSALIALEQWDWPGNIRELRQAVVSAVALLRPGEALDQTHLPARLAQQVINTTELHVSPAQTLAAAIARAERDAIRAAIRAADGAPEAAWRRLGIGKTKFYKKLREHGLLPRHLPKSSSDRPQAMNEDAHDNDDLTVALNLALLHDDQELGPGSLIGNFVIERQLGEGGMGTVWLAEQVEPVRRQVAIKLSRKRRMSGPELELFMLERQAMARINHPSVGQIYEAGALENGTPFFVMEYVQGSTVAATVLSAGCLSMSVSN